MMEMEERLRKKQKQVFLFCWAGYFLTYFGRLNLYVAINAMALEAGVTEFQSVRVVKLSAAFLEHTDSLPGIGNRLGKFILASGLIWIILAYLAQGVIKDGIGLWGPTMLQDLYGVFAKATAALSVQKIGTAPSMPDRKKIEEFLKKRVNS